MTTIVAAGNGGRFLSFWSTMVNAAFSYGGVEMVAVAAGEAENPRKVSSRRKNIHIDELIWSQEYPKGSQAHVLAHSVFLCFGIARYRCHGTLRDNIGSTRDTYLPVRFRTTTRDLMVVRAMPPHLLGLLVFRLHRSTLCQVSSMP